MLIHDTQIFEFDFSSSICCLYNVKRIDDTLSVRNISSINWMYGKYMSMEIVFTFNLVLGSNDKILFLSCKIFYLVQYRPTCV